MQHRRRAFYRAGYIESWGKGIQKIYESCKELGVPAPEYSIVGEDITVKFTAHDSIFSDTDNSISNDTVDTKIDTNDTIADTELMILKAINDNPHITRVHLSSMLGISEATIGRCIQTLKTAGVIKRIGSTRNGYWEIILK